MAETTLRGRRPRSKAVRRRRAFVVALLIVVLILGGVASAAWALLYRSQADIAVGTPVQIEVQSGASTASIAQQLAAAGVVDNANMFRLRTRLAHADGDLKAGVYDLAAGMGYDLVIEVLMKGPEIVYYTVTIPEGFVIEQIAQRLEEQAGVPAEEFLALAQHGGASEFPDRPYLAEGYEGSLEGYLFPKTYRVREGSTAREAIEMMLDQFESEMEAVDLAPAEARGMTLHEVVTVASIIEREAKLADERPLVSSVIYNRLARGQRLEICATIEYVLPEAKFRLTNADLQIDSPYNSYQREGLPPGPISNPGIASIQAAVNPADTDYLYYVLTGEDGSHTFTSNYQDFEAAKRLSKEVFGE